MEKFSLDIQKSATALWFITSPQVRGLLLAERDLAAGLAKVPGAIRELEEARLEVERTKAP